MNCFLFFSLNSKLFQILYLFTFYVLDTIFFVAKLKEKRKENLKNKQCMLTNRKDCQYNLMLKLKTSRSNFEIVYKFFFVSNKLFNAKRLAHYVYEYLTHLGAKNSAQAFLNEVNSN